MKRKVTLKASSHHSKKRRIGVSPFLQILMALLLLSTLAWAETSVMFDFEDLEAQQAAQEDKIDHARTVLHEIFSAYSVENMLTASVNIRDNGRPDVEVDPNTGYFLINCKIAVNEDVLNNWIESAKAKLASIADSVEETKRSNELSDDYCVIDGSKYIFDKSIKFKKCAVAFLPSRRSTFSLEIISKDGERLFQLGKFFDEVAKFDVKDRNPSIPMPYPLQRQETYVPTYLQLSLGKCEYLPKIKEIRCSFGQFDESKIPEIAQKHPVKKIPLKYGVCIEMVEIAPGIYCSKHPVCNAQAFACDSKAFSDRIPSNFRFSSGLQIHGMPMGVMLLNDINNLPSVKASGFTFRLPTETEWIYAARGGSNAKITFGLAADGSEGILGYPGWINKDKNGKYEFYDDAGLPLAQKMPNAYGIYDMVGMYPELCIRETSNSSSPSYSIRLGLFDLSESEKCRGDVPIEKDYDNDSISYGKNHSLRLFAGQKLELQNVE